MDTYSLYDKKTNQYITGSNDIKYIKDHLTNIIAISNSIFTFILSEKDYIIYKNKGYKNQSIINK